MAKLVAIIFLFLSTSLDAQTVIMGKVIANSGDPVSGVHIYCIENEKGATTDSLGFFQLECIIPSTLEFTHINYKKETYKLTKSDVPFVIILRNKRNNLKEVVVTALPASGRVLSSIKGIERIPAILGEQDVLKYLATMPGIVTTNALNSGIYVRGETATRTGSSSTTCPSLTRITSRESSQPSTPTSWATQPYTKAASPPVTTVFYPLTSTCAPNRVTKTNTKAS